MLAYQSEAQYLKYSPWTHRRPRRSETSLAGFVELQRPASYKYQLAPHCGGRTAHGNCASALRAPTRGKLTRLRDRTGILGEGYASEA